MAGDVRGVKWRWLKPEEREKRNVHVLELWQMGLSRQEIAQKVDVTPQRVSQIILSFGIRERTRRDLANP